MPDITDKDLQAESIQARVAAEATACINEMEDLRLLAAYAPDCNKDHNRSNSNSNSPEAVFSPRYYIYLSICTEQAFCHALLFHISGQIDCALFQDWQQSPGFYHEIISEEDRKPESGGFERWRLVH